MHSLLKKVLVKCTCLLVFLTSGFGAMISSMVGAKLTVLRNFEWRFLFAVARFDSSASFVRSFEEETKIAVINRNILIKETSIWRQNNRATYMNGTCCSVDSNMILVGICFWLFFSTEKIFSVLPTHNSFDTHLSWCHLMGFRDHRLMLRHHSLAYLKWSNRVKPFQRPTFVPMNHRTPE